MSLARLTSSAIPVVAHLPDPALRALAPPGYRGHAHFWDRALSRRRVVRGGAGLALVGAGLGHRGRVLAQEGGGATPKPIPGGIDLGGGQLIHVYDYSQGFDPSTITDFRGLVGINHIRGTGTVTTDGGGGGLSTPTATGDVLHTDVDMRFMQGTYVGEDGQEHEGTFGFV